MRFLLSSVSFICKWLIYRILSADRRVMKVSAFVSNKGED